MEDDDHVEAVEDIWESAGGLFLTMVQRHVVQTHDTSGDWRGLWQ